MHRIPNCTSPGERSNLGSRDLGEGRNKDFIYGLIKQYFFTKNLYFKKKVPNARNSLLCIDKSTLQVPTFIAKIKAKVTCKVSMI